MVKSDATLLVPLHQCHLHHPFVAIAKHVRRRIHQYLGRLRELVTIGVVRHMHLLDPIIRRDATHDEFLSHGILMHAHRDFDQRRNDAAADRRNRQHQPHTVLLALLLARSIARRQL